MILKVLLKEAMTKKKLVVVDADTLVFRSAAVSEERRVNVKHIPSGRERIYKNRTEFKSAMKEKNFEIKPEDFEYEDIQEEQPIEYCLHTIKMQTDAILERFKDSYVVFVAGDSNNFRLDLPLPKRYKSNRDNMLRPVHLAKAKEYFIDKYKAISANGYEADDLSAILAYDGVKAKKEVILASPDKDSKQFVGLQIFDYTKPEEGIKGVVDWHPIELNSKKEFKSYGIPFLAYQLLCGDSTDFYKPTDLCNAKFGDVAAYKLLTDCKSSTECLQAVVEQYKKWYPEPVTYNAWNANEHTKDWKGILQLYFYCAKMKQSEDDELNAEEFFYNYGVKL